MNSTMDRSRSGFGLFGTRFEELRVARDAAAEALWNRPGNRQMALRHNWDAARSRFYDPSGYWYDVAAQIIALSLKTGTGLERLRFELPLLWEKLRSVFAPSLKAWASTALNAEFAQGVAAVSSCYFNAFRIPEAVPLLSVSFAGFSTVELSYIASKHRKLFDAGGGSFYLASILHGAGVGVVTVDNGSFDKLYDRDAPWYQHAMNAGITRRGSVLDHLDALGAGTSLLIAWPEPGSLWPCNLLKEHRSRGGRQLLLKPGLFVGRIEHSAANRDYVAPVDPVGNVLAFLDELAANWTQVTGPEVPEYHPDNYMDQLWVFTTR